MFGGVLDERINPLALVGYDMIMANSAFYSGYLSSHIQCALME